MFRLSDRLKDSTPCKLVKHEPCWWFSRADTYEDVCEVVRHSDNLSFTSLIECLTDALVRASKFKPSLVPHITKILSEKKGMFAWEQLFLDRFDREPLAKKAWLRIEGARLGHACKTLLWEYANCQKHFAEIQRGTNVLVRNMQSFERARRQEERHASDHRVQMFRERRENATRVLAQTPWPFHNPGKATFLDAVRADPSPDLFDLRRIRALMGRSGLSYLLANLRAGARKYSVNLSGNEIAALVYCATGSRLDAGAVRRYLRQPWISKTESDYQSLFDSFIASGR